MRRFLARLLAVALLLGTLSLGGCHRWVAFGLGLGVGYALSQDVHACHGSCSHHGGYARIHSYYDCD